MGSTKETIMDWIQVLTIIGVLGSIMIYFIIRLENDIQKLGNRLDGHASRIDQLYHMFVDLLRSGKS